MIEPGTRLTFTKAGHAYALHLPNGTTSRVRSVTAVSSAGRAPALERWNARITADATARDWDTLAQCDPTERLERMRAYATIERTRAAARGTAVHAAGELLVRGQAANLPADPIEAAMIETYARWLSQPEQAWLLDASNLVEQRLLLPAMRGMPPVAGTSDMIATHNGKRIIVDLKTRQTGKLDPRAEWAAQLWAYGIGHNVDAAGMVDVDPPARAAAGSVIIITPDGVRQVWLRGQSWAKAGRVWRALRAYTASTIDDKDWSND